MQSHGHSPIAPPAVPEGMNPVMPPALVSPPLVSTPAIMDEGDAIILEEDELEEAFVDSPNEDELEDFRGFHSIVSAQDSEGNVYVTKYASDPTLEESSSLELDEDLLTDASELTMFRKDTKKDTKHPHYCYCRRVRVSSYGGARNRYPCNYL